MGSVARRGLAAGPGLMTGQQYPVFLFDKKISGDHDVTVDFFVADHGDVSAKIERRSAVDVDGLLGRVAENTCPAFQDLLAPGQRRPARVQTDYRAFSGPEGVHVFEIAGGEGQIEGVVGEQSILGTHRLSIRADCVRSNQANLRLDKILYIYTVFRMPLILCRKLNHRNIELHHSSRGESVGVLRRNGDYRFVPWLGFIDRNDARTRGRPVKLVISRVGQLDGARTLWRDLGPGEYVQGCLTRAGAFAVTDTDIRVIS
jgi:hypothetical protein